MVIVETKARCNFFSWFAYTIFSLGLFILPIILALESIKKNDLPFVIPIIILQYLVCFLALRLVFWFIYGRETLQIKKDSLINSKKGTYCIKHESRILLSEIKSVKVNKSFHEENYPNADLIHWFYRQSYIFKIQNTGRIKIETKNGRTFKFLDNLTLVEAENIVSEIENHLKSNVANTKK